MGGFYEDWKKRYDATLELNAEERSNAVLNLDEEIETGLKLAGITAIEDKLQDKVPESIVSIKEAGIRFWVLTGDKTETAVEIVKACQLFTDEMNLAYMVNITDMDGATQALQQAKATLQKSGNNSGGLVIDGTLLSHVLGDYGSGVLLYDLAMICRACVCCRL